MKLAEMSELMSSERKASQLRVAEYEDYIATLKDELDSVKSKCKPNRVLRQNGVLVFYLGFECWSNIVINVPEWFNVH